MYLEKPVGGVRATSIRAIAKSILGPVRIHICEPNNSSNNDDDKDELNEPDYNEDNDQPEEEVTSIISSDKVF